MKLLRVFVIEFSRNKNMDTKIQTPFNSRRLEELQDFAKISIWRRAVLVLCGAFTVILKYFPRKYDSYRAYIVALICRLWLFFIILHLLYICIQNTELKGEYLPQLQSSDVKSVVNTCTARVFVLLLEEFV